MLIGFVVPIKLHPKQLLKMLKILPDLPLTPTKIIKNIIFYPPPPPQT